MTVVPLPSNLKVGKVVARMLAAVSDTANDTNYLPEGVRVCGDITFTPRVTASIVPPSGEVPSAAILRRAIVCAFNAEGYLYQKTGSLTGEVWLETGIWDVDFKLEGWSRPGFAIEVTENHTAEAPLDLWTVMPYVPPTEDTVVNVLAVPSGADLGDLLSWNGSTLTWSDGLDPEAVVSAVSATLEAYLEEHPLYAAINAAMSDHLYAADPHPVYLTEAEGSSLFASTEQGVKADSASQPGHTHTLAEVNDAVMRLAMTPAERTKLSGVATGATANATDAQLRDRATHTGTQAAATLSDLVETVQDIVGALIVAGSNTTVSYNDAAGTFTINAATGTVTDPEIVRDVIGAALVAGAGIQITVNDAGDTLTIASTAVLPTRQVIAGTGLTGGGDLSADRTLSVSFGSTAGSAAEGNHTHAAATETATGVVELATVAETITGTDTGRAVTPAGLKAVADGKAAADAPALSGRYSAINAQTGTAYTLVAADAGKLVTLANAAPVTLTIPSATFAAGQRIDCLVLGAGMVTVVGSGVTVAGTPSLVSRAQYSALTVVMLSASSAVVVGDLA